MKLTLIAIMLLLASSGDRCFGQKPDASVEVGSIAATETATESEAGAQELDAIRDASKAFVVAFNRHDANAVAALWTMEGEYVDGAGRVLVGRDAIAKDYQAFFAANPDAKITITIDSLRRLASDTAIEDGRASVESSNSGAGEFTNYTAVHAKVDGQWLMASVRDSLIESQPSVTSGRDLEWLIGEWRAEEHGVRVESDCRWVVDGRFIRRMYTTTHVDGSTSSGLQLIGWNPQAAYVQSWDFSPDGGHAVGTWMPQDGGWSAQMHGVTGDGTLTTAINQLRRLDDNAYVWQSIQRTAGGFAVPDTDEVIIKRLSITQ